MSGRKFEPSGLLAIEPRAFGMLLASEWKAPSNEEHGPITVVNVRGPLMHHEDPCSDSYDAIKARAAAAFSSSAMAVVLRIDSPGGLVSGCFDTMRELRRMAETARKPLYAYVDNACSAAYALACGCSKIFAAASGVVGSIGVIDTVLDVTELDARQGVKVAIVTSGARKADSNPHTPLTDSKLAATQARRQHFQAFWRRALGSSTGSPRSKKRSPWWRTEAPRLRQRQKSWTTKRQSPRSAR
jgi:capsid assembly protease